MENKDRCRASILQVAPILLFPIYFLDCTVLYHLSSGLLIHLPAQIYCWTPQWVFHFNYFSFQLQNFLLLGLFLIIFSLFIYSIWKKYHHTLIVLIMVSFISLSIFITPALKSLLSPTSGLSQRQIVLHDFSHIFIILSFFFACSIICYWKLDIYDNIL